MKSQVLIRKVKLLLGMDWRTKRAAAEALYFLGKSRWLLLRIPFVKIASQLGEVMQESTYENNQAHRRELVLVHSVVDWVSKYTPWESKCLVRALTAMKMLERRGIDSTLYLGTAKDDGSLIAHAWLRSGSFYITGAEEMERFTVVTTFAKQNTEPRSRDLHAK